MRQPSVLPQTFSSAPSPPARAQPRRSRVRNALAWLTARARGGPARRGAGEALPVSPVERGWEAPSGQLGAGRGLSRALGCGQWTVLPLQPRGRPLAVLGGRGGGSRGWGRDKLCGTVASPERRGGLAGARRGAVRAAGHLRATLGAPSSVAPPGAWLPPSRPGGTRLRGGQGALLAFRGAQRRPPLPARALPFHGAVPSPPAAPRQGRTPWPGCRAGELLGHGGLVPPRRSPRGAGGGSWGFAGGSGDPSGAGAGLALAGQAGGGTGEAAGPEPKL